MGEVVRKTIAVIAAKDEESTIAEVVRETLRYVNECIVVDDGSTDFTGVEARKAGAFVISLPENKGKSEAVLVGCDTAVKLGATHLVLLDADAQHNPAEIPKLINVLNHGCDLVFASREYNKKMPIIKRIGNVILTQVIGLLSGVKVNDAQSGYKAMTVKGYEKIKWDGKGYTIETDIIFNVAKAKMNYGEVFIETTYHNPKKGTNIKDGINIFKHILKRKVRG